VHHTGRLENGTQLAGPEGAFVFPLGLGRVTKGLDEGVASKRVGGKRG
jgi:FKBP-type peptidyl-prolyl cis-trans isomerase